MSGPIVRRSPASGGSPTSGSDSLLAALLRGEAVAPAALEAESEALWAHALMHDIIPLIADRLGALPDRPGELAARFQNEAHKMTAADLAREAALRELLAAFAARGIDALVVKGSHLAYSHYTRPDLRARIDTDLLVALSDRERADVLLTRELGYAPDRKPSGSLTATQKLYVLTRNDAEAHLVDLHWRLASPQVFAHVLSFEALRERSLRLPALGPSARVPSDVDALLIACTHRIAHHHDEAEQFKWLWDIHLLASRLSDAQWDTFAARAAEREVAAVSAEGLRRSAFWFNTPVPDRIHLDADLISASAAEGTAAFLEVRPKAIEVLDDLRALPSWSDRVRLAREHLFPSVAYMREVYAPASALPLPLLYVRRMLLGGVRWLRRRGSAD